MAVGQMMGHSSALIATCSAVVCVDDIYMIMNSDSSLQALCTHSVQIKSLNQTEGLFLEQLEWCLKMILDAKSKKFCKFT